MSTEEHLKEKGDQDSLFKLKIGHVLSDWNRNVEVIGREYREQVLYKGTAKERVVRKKFYQIKCNKCGLIRWINDYYLINEHKGCLKCDTKLVGRLEVGVNDFSSVYPEYAKLLKNPDEGKKHSSRSNDKLIFKCPYCGREYLKSINAVVMNGLSCFCKDGISYPNKFIFCLIEQVGVKFTPEKSFPWSNGRMYDEYIEYNGQQIIVEMHGKQHYHETNSYWNRDLLAEQENDVYKMQLATQNGIDHYFAINSSESNMVFLRNNIIESGLLDVLNVKKEDINWQSCAEFATSNITKTVCDYKVSHPDMNLYEIADALNIRYHLVVRYVKIGDKLGWCHYIPGENNKRKEKHALTKPVCCVEDGMYFRSSDVACDYYSTTEHKYYGSNLRKTIRNGTTYNGLTFQYITREEFNKAKSESPDKVVGGFFISKENLNAERMQGSAQ